MVFLSVVLLLILELLMQFLLATDYIRVQLLTILADRELLVVVKWNVNLLFANGLIIRVMELSHVRMFQCFFGCRSLLRVEL